MTWNHRAFRRTFKTRCGQPDVLYSIHEAYYDKNGRMDGYTAEPVAPVGDSLKDLRQVLTWMRRATFFPVVLLNEKGDRIKQKTDDMPRRKKK